VKPSKTQRCALERMATGSKMNSRINDDMDGGEFWVDDIDITEDSFYQLFDAGFIEMIPRRDLWGHPVYIITDAGSGAIGGKT